MDLWGRSSFTERIVLRLVEDGLLTGELDREEIKKHIKLVLESVPTDTALDVHLPMHPNDGFIEMVSPLFLSSPFPWLLCVPLFLT
jgi:hypothetical protein